MSLVETLPSESLQPNRLLRDAVVDENVIALLKSVSDYPEQDRLRWNSAEPLKGKRAGRSTCYIVQPVEGS